MSTFGIPTVRVDEQLLSSRSARKLSNALGADQTLDVAGVFRIIRGGGDTRIGSQG